MSLLKLEDSLNSNFKNKNTKDESISYLTNIF